MLQRITSLQNEKLKNFARLYRRKYREKWKLYVAEGINLVEEALKNGAEFDSAFVREDFFGEAEGKVLAERLGEKNCDIFVLPKALFDHTVNTDTPQGIAAAVKQPDCDVGHFFDGKPSNVIVLDRLQDPGNLGTIIRTADAAGFRRILVMKGTADIFSPKTVRAAAGSLYRVSFAYANQPEEALRLLSDRRFRTVCTSPRAEKNYFEEDIAENTALIIGNEANGACDEFMQKARLLVSIPMEGTVESLNAGVAASVIMYESVRQRLRKRAGP